MCACGFRHHRQDRIPREDLATRIRVILIEHQINFGCLMAALLGQRPDLEVIAQTGSLTEASRRTTMLRFDLMVLDHVAALQALRLNQRGQDLFGFTGQWHGSKPPPIWIENN